VGAAEPQRGVRPNPSPRSRCYWAFLLVDLNLIPSFIAFCAAAPRVRGSFFADCGCDKFDLANSGRFFSSKPEFDRRFVLLLDLSGGVTGRIIEDLRPAAFQGLADKSNMWEHVMSGNSSVIGP